MPTKQSSVGDHPGFLADILEHPEDDVPRLIYADWLQDNGQEERAEFIRLQVEIAEREQKHTAIVPRLMRRVGKILGNYGSAWFLAATDRAIGNWFATSYRAIGNWFATSSGILSIEPATELLFCRGFVAEVKCNLDFWEVTGPTLVTRQPVERVVATDVLCVPNDSWTFRSVPGTHLPDWLVQQLSCPMRWWHETKEAACRVLSDTLLAWSRAQARHSLHAS